MTIKECYEQIGADYEDVRSRLRSDLLIRKFFLKFPDDKSFGQLKEALKSGDREGAFRAALEEVNDAFAVVNEAYEKIIKTAEQFIKEE